MPFLLWRLRSGERVPLNNNEWRRSCDRDTGIDLLCEDLAPRISRHGDHRTPAPGGGSRDPPPPPPTLNPDSLAGPDDPERARRLPSAKQHPQGGAQLFQRVWREDVLRCFRCGGEMCLVALLRDPTVIERILRYLGLWPRGPPEDRQLVVEPTGDEPTYLG